MAKPEQAPKTYRGNCHCGAFVYEVELPEIKSVNECNCSICYKKGYLWLFPPADAFKIVKGDEDALTAYSFSTGTTLHKFCPTCATPLMGVRPAGPPGKNRALNAHAIQGLNTWELERVPFNGEALDPPYQPPKHTGPEPSVEIENAKTYYGSCHCGSVTLALKSVPLDKDYPDRLLECCCSICERNAYVWVYPTVEQVVIHGKENLGRYMFGQRLFAKTFCKTCGICLTNDAADLSDEQVAALSDGSRKWHERGKVTCPTNLRVLNNFNVKDAKDPEKLTHGTKIEPQYVNP